MKHLTVTAACNAANQCVGRPVKFGQHSWQVFYREPDETATRTMQACSYHKALAMMLETKASTAIQLLGESWDYAWNDGPYYNVITNVRAGMNWRKAVSLAHKQAIAQ